jgi:signal transduction histidine kinase
MQEIFNLQFWVILLSAGVMGFLLLILRTFVKRGEAILWKRADEQIRLEEQLSRAERLASMGEMAAAVSHEIRNPLGIIRSSAQLLKKKMPEEKVSGQLLDVVIEECSRLNDIITDFLNFARPQKPRILPCRIQDVLAKNLSFLEARLEQDGFRVKTIYEEGIPEIQGDPNLLYQAFLNILLNAMQAMPGGGGINIEVRADTQKVAVAVSDEGPGVDESIMRKIWNPFFTTKEKGTGLGLCVVRNIIEAHKGKVWMENAQGRGACVHIELPAGIEDGNHPDS